MSSKTSIEWTEQTWNPAVGCSKISPGCTNCYAEVMARRLQAMRVKGYENGFRLTLLPVRLQEPIRRKRPTVYFVNSMSDLFHEEIPDDYLVRVLEVIRAGASTHFSDFDQESRANGRIFPFQAAPPQRLAGRDCGESRSRFASS